MKTFMSVMEAHHSGEIMPHAKCTYVLLGRGSFCNDVEDTFSLLKRILCLFKTM